MMASGGARSVTLQDVAREAGVSVGAASFVMSGRGGRGSAGSEATQEAVRAAARRLGYVPNRHARAIRTGRSNVIALDLGLVGDPWSTSLVEVVQSRAREHDLTTIVLAGGSWFEYLSGYGCAAGLLTELHGDGLIRLDQLSAQGVPLIAYGTGIEPGAHDVIDTNPLPAVGHAYRALRERHERVAMVTHTAPGSTSWTSRTDAFVDAVRADDRIVDDQSLLFTPGSRRESYLQACEWLARTRPTAVIGATGYLALAVQAAAWRMGIHVPEELEIVSLGDVPTDAQMLGQVSYWGVHDVFERTAEIVLARARDGHDRPGELHHFEWQYFPGETTREQAPTWPSTPM